MAHDVFISYSSKDKPAADAVCARLEAAEVRCWIAPRDILPGNDWSEAIIDAIEGSTLMVLVFSSHANASQQIKREVERAVNKGIPIVPLRIENVMPIKSLEYFISTPHWLDAITPPLEDHLEYLSDTVRLLLKRTSEMPERPPPVKIPIWKKPKFIAAAVVAAVLLLFVAKRALIAPPEVESALVGSWISAQPETGITQRQINQEDGHYENTMTIVEEGTLRRKNTSIYLAPNRGPERLISWEWIDTNTAKSLLIPNTLWGFVGITNPAAGGDINYAALNAVWKRNPPAAAGSKGIDHWEYSPTMGGQLWNLTFDLTADSHYTFRATHVDNGKLRAREGKWTSVTGTQNVWTGEYQLLDKDTISLGTKFGPVLWKRSANS